jgi:uncharacterized OsmC-like protein
VYRVQAQAVVGPLPAYFVSACAACVAAAVVSYWRHGRRGSYHRVRGEEEDEEEEEAAAEAVVAEPATNESFVYQI